MRYKICGFQVLLCKLFFRNSWRKCFQEFYASSCVVMQLSSNDNFSSIPTDTYLLNHCFNGFSPLPPFRKKKIRLGEGLQISAHQAVEWDNISKTLKLGVQFWSEQNHPKHSWMWPKWSVYVLSHAMSIMVIAENFPTGKSKWPFSKQYNGYKFKS